MKQIAVIGGHGQVGQDIVKVLVGEGYTVVLMGRNLGKMAAFAQTFTPALTMRQIDITKNVKQEDLADIDMVIVCLDQTDTQFVRTCQEAGIDYLDISANSDFLTAISQLPRPKKSRRLVGVGLAPGITNVAATTYAAAHPAVTSIHIDILLGLGDKHGAAAVEWTFAQLNRGYQHPSWQHNTENFVHGKKTNFGKGIGQRRSYNFDFADQHLLNERDQTRIYTTYLGFDQNTTTALLAQIKRKGLAGMFKNRFVLSSLVWFMQKGFFGSQQFVVKISDGTIEDPHQIVLYGEEEAKMTAEVAAYAAVKLLEEILPAGDYQLPDIVTLEDLYTLPRVSKAQ